ncbi:Digestive cysteine proteinase 2 [Thelohanellus kitauei]|uniref:Digestive cysteine proteinase 2 n=1 Tax=Thelohanellus kitauei TaxID=669202 RepID=A0A0C2IYM6_THEKT|nr:Digestive cysteine proteinase 2 [Thelohanellus kitauei]
MRLVGFIYLLFNVAITLEIENLVSPGLWNQHKRKYNLMLSQTEEVERRAIYFDNLKYIEDINSQNLGFKLAMNEYGHMRPSELTMSTIMKRHLPLMLDDEPSSEVPLNKSLQKLKTRKCGSCYAFSGVGALESHIALETGKLINLSEQEIVDCSIKEGNNGCHGGYPDDVFKYAIQHGLSLESDYNYVAKEGDCRRSNTKTRYRLLSYVDIPGGHENKLISAVSSKGPVSVSFDAKHREFMLYHSGILRIRQCRKDQMNHAVLIVGYSIDPSGSYYIVKNSWGTKWGESGYFRMAMNENMCGIASWASYPVPKV